MTVAELIAQLQALPPETPVFVDVPSQMDGGSYLFELDPPILRQLDEWQAREVNLPQGAPALIIR